MNNCSCIQYVANDVNCSLYWHVGRIEEKRNFLILVLHWLFCILYPSWFLKRLKLTLRHLVWHVQLRPVIYSKKWTVTFTLRRMLGCICRMKEDRLGVWKAVVKHMIWQILACRNNSIFQTFLRWPDVGFFYEYLLARLQVFSEDRVTVLGMFVQRCSVCILFLRRFLNS